MTSGMITLGFIGLVVFLGKHLFSVGDWGKPVKPYSGIVHGKYRPPAYRRNMPIGKVDMEAYRDFHARHGVVSGREFHAMMGRS